MDNVCNRRLFSFPAKVEVAEEQEYLCCPCNLVPRVSHLPWGHVCSSLLQYWPGGIPIVQTIWKYVIRSASDIRTFFEELSTP